MGCISKDQNYAVQSIFSSAQLARSMKFFFEFMLEKKWYQASRAFLDFSSPYAETAWVHILEPRETKGLDRYSSFEN